MPGAVGAATVRVAAVVVALPALLVKMASYSLLLMAVVTLDSVSVVLVAPLMVFQLEPPLVLTSHCTVGVGLPLAAAVNDTLAPAVTVWLVGWVVMTGAVVVTVRVAAVVVTLPALLVKMASYSLPLMVVVTLDSVSVVLVAPLMLLQLAPP